MKVIKGLSLILLSAGFAFSASFPISNSKFLANTWQNNKSIDLVFAGTFDAKPHSILASEQPFSGLLPALEAGHEEVGFTTGDFAVDQTGQASYVIPIFSGVGTAGVAPKVALQYSSAGGNGHVGVGWSISGVTVISRCRETAESKDVTGKVTPSPITFGIEDKFCLNGERLFVSNGGEYGANGTVYRTEKDQFARITSLGGTANNPDTFTVERKDGSISSYGVTTDSNITITSSNNDINGKTYTWAINRYQDTMGNYIDYSYDKLSNSEFILSDINYTGNDKLDQELLPYNNLHFVYEPRADEFTSYLSGVAFDTSQRLAMIESRIDGVIVRDYTLDYELSETTSRSILKTIQECRGTDCLKPAIFSWSQPDKQFKSNTATYSAFPKDIKSSKLGDTNGDARGDLIFVDESENVFKVAYAAGHSGFGVTSSTGITAPTGSEIDNKWHLIDYNADGKQDLMKQSGDQWVIHLAQSFGFETTPIPTGITAPANSDFKIVDLNGDGLADLLYPQAGLSVRYLERVGNSYQFSDSVVGLQLPTNYNQIEGVPAPPSNPSYLVYQYYQDDDINFNTPDVNGDGVADLVLRADVYYTELPDPDSIDEAPPYYFLSAGEEASSFRGEPTEQKHSSQWVALVGRGINGNGKLNYSIENHFIEPASIHGGDDEALKFIDINADGLVDVFTKITANNWGYRLGTGKGFTSTQAISSISNEDHMHFIDHDLDGYLDLLYPIGATGNAYYVKRWQGGSFAATGLFTGAKAENLTQNINMFLDFDGDGAVDHLRIDDSGNQKLYPRVGSFLAVDRIKTFTSGLGAGTKVLYRPLTFSSTYKQGDHQTAGVNYGLGSPVLDVMGALYVVRQVDLDAPTESNEAKQTSTRYRYENARVQTGGRGFLGFEKVVTATPVLGQDDAEAKILETTTTYRQDFPFNGIPANSQIRQLDANFYAAENLPPVCTGNDCLPNPCLPGEVCDDLPRDEGGNALLSDTAFTPNILTPTAKSQFPYIETASLNTYSPESNELLKTEVQHTTHDNYGNPLVHTVTIKDGFGAILQTNITTNSYSNITSGGKWLLGLLETSSTVKTKAGQPSITTHSEFDYDYNTGLLIEERQDPKEGSELFLRKRYHYDEYGNTLKIIFCSGSTLTASQCDNNTPIPASSSSPYHLHRYERTEFDSKGRYVVANFNTEEQKLSEVLTRDIYGNPLTSIGILNQTTTNTYDTFGRQNSTRNTLGTWSQTSRQWCVNLTGTLACPVGMAAQIRVRKKVAGGSTSYIYMDSVGREVATITQSFNAADDANTSGDDRYVMNKIWHDQYGRKVKSVGNHFLNAMVNIPITTTAFDRYNRSTEYILADNTTKESMSYMGFTTNHVNDKGQRRQELKNALNQLIEVKDLDDSGQVQNFKNSIAYVYDSQGALKHVSRNANGSYERLIENNYDIRGRKISSSDVDTGFSEIFYNAIGEVVESIDSEGNSIKTYHDTLGRAYQVESWDDSTQLTRNTNSYNINNGLLETEIKLINSGEINYTQRHSYDSFKRPQTTDISFTDTDNVCSTALCTYQAKLYYDQYSRLKFQQDVSGEAIRNHYNERGFISHVTDASDGTKEYYRINRTDKWGNVLSDTKSANQHATYTFHPTRGWLNSISSNHQSYVYEYDSIGNLGKRADLLNNQSECFLYDRLNRLTDTYRYNFYGQACVNTGNNIEHQETNYDVKGNLTRKDNIDYTYMTGSNTTIGASPHQVQAKGSQSFYYDDRGNLSRSTNFRNRQGQTVDRNISYTGFNKIKRVYTGSDSNNPIDESVYRYNNTEDRYSRTDRNSDDITTVTHFMGSVEVEYNANGQVAFKRHLGNFAVVTETNNSTQEAYLFHDHLGSVDVITDNSGRLLQSTSFSAWGERRVPNSWQDIPLQSSRAFLSDYTSKGFTGHEMLDAFGIINMGGRIYDAELGKMLQADPIVQDPNTSQSFNRYVYVHNNPLSFTDPTGYFSLRQLVGAVVAIALSYFLPVIGFDLFWTAFTVGFTSTYVITGNFKSALRAGMVAGAVAFVGSQFSNSGGANAANAGNKAASGGAGDTAASTALSETAPITTSASAVGLVSSISAFDIALQVASILNPKAGAVLAFLNGGNVDFSDSATIGATIQNLISHYGKFKASEELARFARKNGMTMAELNLALVTMSFVGNKLVGSRFETNGTVGGKAQQRIRGMFDRVQSSGLVDSETSPVLNKILSSSFDVIDVVLGYTGLLTASDYDFLRRGNVNQSLYGHSLGTLGVSNLVSRGYLDAGLAHLDSLPFGNVAPAGVGVDLGNKDFVNGLVLGLLFNPFASIVNLGWGQHAMHRYHGLIKNEMGPHQ